MNYKETINKCLKRGYEVIIKSEDFNNGNNEGMGYFPLNVKNGYRCSS